MKQDKLKKTCVVFLGLLCSSMAGAQVFESDMARFHWDDNMEWKNPKFDDSDWQLVSTSRDMIGQGGARNQSYAWYRLHFQVDKNIFEGADQQLTLRLTMPYVDDADVTYLNGVRVGGTGRLPDDPQQFASAWQVPRIYFVPASALNIGGDNVLAIRMFNEGGGCGMSIDAGKPEMHFSLTVPSRVDGIKFSGEEVVVKGKKVVNLTLQNDFDGKQVGELRILSTDPQTGQEFYTTTKKISVAPRKSMTVAIPCVEGYQRIQAQFTDKATQKTADFAFTPKYILTPKAPETPRFNMAGIFGVRPGSPVIYRLPVSGKRPMKFSVKNLPEGLSLDAEKGVISGTLSKRGEYILSLTAQNDLGKDEAQLTICVGNTIGLTPPMGWNSWNCWGLSVTQEKVIASAQALIDRGLADYGWAYINIDDGWEAPERNADGTIDANEKFPDMKGLSDWLHSEGLKFGIYSSPGEETCGGFLGSLDHDLQDAETYNSWGVDYLKYDWCSYGKKHETEPDGYSKASFVRPFLKMEEGLRAQPRDIFYSIDDYGWQDVWEWGDLVDANSWRTTNDITDTWESLYDIGFKRQAGLHPWAKPGHWNDPDMLIVGRLGWSANLRDTNLTPDEQYTHISLWCLLAANLLIGCDLTEMDDFTHNLLCNNEVIAVNQDVLGEQAAQVVNQDSIQVWMRQLSDGTHAVGIFNLNDTDVNVDFAKYLPILGLKNTQYRDLWRQEDISDTNFFIPSHGVKLLKVR